MKKMCVAVAAVVLTMATITGCSSPTPVNANDYLSVKTEGYDGYGTAALEFDKDKFTKDFSEKLENADKVADIIDDAGTLSTEKDVKNGDVIKFTWKLSDEDAETLKKEYKCEVTGKDFEQKVEGLKELPQGDFKADVDVTNMVTKEVDDTLGDTEFEWQGNLSVPVTLNLTDGKYTFALDADGFKNSFIDFIAGNADALVNTILKKQLGDTISVEDALKLYGASSIWDVMGVKDARAFAEMIEKEFDISDIEQKTEGDYTFEDGKIILKDEKDGDVTLEITDSGLSGKIEASKLNGELNGDLVLDFVPAK
jgi:hypothetical protein